MGRLKGSIMSSETKTKIKATKEFNKLNKNITGFTAVVLKPVMKISGKEIIGNDFFTSLRKCLRPANQSQLCKELEYKITRLDVYNNIPRIKNILSEYVTIELNDPTKVIKIRKPRKPLTDEARKILIERMAKARECRKNNKKRE
jgi:hypothetical protein